MTNDDQSNVDMSRSKKKNRILLWLALSSLISIGIIVGGFWYLLRTPYRISDNFEASAHSTFLEMRQCQADVETTGDACNACLKSAQEKLATTHSKTKTMADRGIYYYLESYRKAIETSHHDWQTGNASLEAKAHHDEMVDWGNRLKWLEH